MNKSVIILGFKKYILGVQGNGSVGKVLFLQHEELNSDAPNLWLLKN